MRAVVQRVSEALVTVDSRPVAAIEQGLLVYLGVAAADDDADLRYLVDKVRHLRVFSDEYKRMNLDVGPGGGKGALGERLYGPGRRSAREAAVL